MILENLMLRVADLEAKVTAITTRLAELDAQSAPTPAPAAQPAPAAKTTAATTSAAKTTAK